MLARTVLPGVPAAVLLALGGCASVPSTHLARVKLGLPLRVLALQAPMGVDRGRLQEVFAPDVKAKLAADDPRLSQPRQRGQVHAAAMMAAAIAREPELIALSPASADGALDPLRGRLLTRPLTPEEAARLRAATGADALLRYGITDYGLTPVAWRHGYIAFEVVTTLGLAALIAYSGSRAAQAAATVYLVQETAEETAEAYAGFDVLDEVCRPVRVQAELVDLKPHLALWQSSDTGFSDVRLGRYFRKVGAQERERQLDQATASAVRGVMADLHRALRDKRLRLAVHAD